LIAGYILDINNAIKFKPALLTKWLGAPLQVDLSGNFMFNENSSLGCLGGVLQLPQWLFKSDAMYVGYAYDFETTRLNNYNSGSHEIFLRYELFKIMIR
jgi:hypothetical protein